MSRFYRVSFDYVDSSGTQLNQSLFGTKDLALSFAIQIGRASNIHNLTCDLVNVDVLSTIDFCDSLHGKNGNYEVKNAK